MGVLPFFSNSKPDKQVISGDWTQQELSEFYRVHNMLNQNGIHVDMDRGVTDRDEPWFVFVDFRSDEVFLHIARLGGQYILVSESIGLKTRGMSLRGTIADFETRICDYFNLNRRETSDSNIVTHPASKLLFVLAALMLVVRSKTALADESRDGFQHSDDQADTSHDALLSHIADAEGSSLRIKNMIGRLHDLSDSPYFVAALVGAFASFHSNDISSSLDELFSYSALASAVDGIESRQGDYHVTTTVHFDNAPLHASFFANRGAADGDINQPVQNVHAVQQAQDFTVNLNVGSLLFDVSNRDTVVNHHDAQDVEHVVVNSSSQMPMSAPMDAELVPQSVSVDASDAGSETVSIMDLINADWLSGNSVTVDYSNLSDLSDIDALELYASLIASYHGDGGQSVDEVDSIIVVSGSKIFFPEGLEKVESAHAFDDNLAIFDQVYDLFGAVTSFYNGGRSSAQIYIVDKDVDGLLASDVMMWQNYFDDGSSIILVGEKQMMQEHFFDDHYIA